MRAKDYTALSLEELRAERRKLDEVHGDEPVRCRFLKATLDALIRIRCPRGSAWIIRDCGTEYASLEDWRLALQNPVLHALPP